MSGHTPGPWTYKVASRLDEDGEQVPLITPVNGENPIAEMTSDYFNAEANARLIAAAPELLEVAVLTEAIIAECFGSNPDEVAEKNPALAGILRLLRPVIAKAEGK